MAFSPLAHKIRGLCYLEFSPLAHKIRGLCYLEFSPLAHKIRGLCYLEFSPLAHKIRGLCYLEFSPLSTQNHWLVIILAINRCKAQICVPDIVKCDRLTTFSTQKNKGKHVLMPEPVKWKFSQAVY